MHTLLAMFEHMKWANHRILQAIKQAGDVSDEITTLFHHLLRAEQVWLTRLQGRDSSHIKIWANCEVDELTDILLDNERQYETYLTSLEDSRLDQIVNYRNQSGKPFDDSVRNILMHVMLHGQYHRGQINAALRREKHEPINVDYIMYVRNPSL